MRLPWSCLQVLHQGLRLTICPQSSVECQSSCSLTHRRLWCPQAPLQTTQGSSTKSYSTLRIWVCRRRSLVDATVRVASVASSTVCASREVCRVMSMLGAPASGARTMIDQRLWRLVWSSLERYPRLFVRAVTARGTTVWRIIASAMELVSNVWKVSVIVMAATIMKVLLLCLKQVALLLLNRSPKLCQVPKERGNVER